MRRFLTFAPALVVLAAVLVAMFAVPALVRSAQIANIGATMTQAQYSLQSSGLLEAISQERSNIHDAVMPGVVHIIATEPGVRDTRDWRFQQGRGASGSGWFWDTQGHIITNAHVVDNAGAIRVELYDGRIRTARIVASDAATDIAILKINANVVLPPKRAQDNNVNVGDVTFVFGSPFGIKFSMSQGSVSGLNRSHGASAMSLRTGYTNYIQTDAAMNPGNSGGPIVNANGEVIGMSSAIANVAQRNRNSDEFMGQSAGIGFAIPLATIDNVVNQLLNDQLPVVIRGYLGVGLDELDPGIARNAGYDGPGVLVSRTFQDSPADKGGMREGDIITAINDQPIASVSVLQSLVSIQEPGVPIKLQVWRAGTGMKYLEFQLGAATLMRNGTLSYLQGSEGMSVEDIHKAIR